MRKHDLRARRDLRQLSRKIEAGHGPQKKDSLGKLPALTVKAIAGNTNARSRRSGRGNVDRFGQGRQCSAYPLALREQVVELCVASRDGRRIHADFSGDRPSCDLELELGDQQTFGNFGVHGASLFCMQLYT